MQNRLNFTIGIIFFLGGCSVYWFGRQNSLFFILPKELSFNLPGLIKFSSPVFFHTFSMILISSPFIKKKISSLFFLSFSWIAIQIFFEIGQKYPDFFNKVFSAGIFLPLNNYFKKGTYDPMDIGMAVAGGLSGLIFLILSRSIVFYFTKVRTYVRKK
ncbi:MAG: hypothetical protein RBR53_01185 [Desulforegulaceae bacterium]|nr:hypothetical protein [Desulforegulaceae bacterium]